MELFRGIKTVLGSQAATTSSGDGPSGAETVERLLERLQSSTLLDDRRDACRALRSLSKRYRVEVGAQGMDALLNALSHDRTDPEIVAYALECLLNVTSPELLDDEDSKMQHVGQQFTEIISKKAENVAVLLSLLEEYDFRIRLPVIRLMTNLLINRPKDIQETLLVSPMSTSKMMDLLSDSREVVRNDAILLLVAVTKNNANIQKIIAFENGFDRILQIIQEEGYSDGGPVVEDCLQLFLNLLRSNTSNLTFFREGSYIKKLVPFFSLPEDEYGWPTQKVSNVHHMFQVVRTLVTPLNPGHVTHSCQKSLKACGILECLCNMLMASGVPADTLTEAIVTVGEAMRGNLENQEFFSSVVAPSDPPRPVLVILLMTLVNERQPLSLRCAVLYCIQSYLYKNEKSQDDIVKTLLPSSADGANSVTAGQLLCGGLFSKDVTSNWFSSVALGYSLLSNKEQKESLLKVQLATKSNGPPITLMNHLLQSLMQGVKPQVKIGFLQFLSVWLESSSTAIAQFLSNQNSIPYLITQTTSTDSDDQEILVHGLSAFLLGICLYFNPNSVPAFTKDNLVQLINNRIGMEALIDGLSNISKSESYLHSLKHPQLQAKHSSDLVFDQTFCLLFKKYESLILLQLTDPDTSPIRPDTSSRNISNNGHMVNSHQSPNEVINRYKEVIRTQDEAIENCKREILGLTSMNSEYKGKVEEMLGEVMLLKSQLTLAQAQRESFDAGQVRQVPEDQHFAIVSQKDNRIQELELKLTQLEGNFGVASNSMQEELIGKLEEENKVLVEEVEKMKKDQEELLELLSEQDNRISEYKAKLRQLGVQVEEDDPEDDLDIVNMPQSGEIFQSDRNEENLLQ